MDRRRRVRNLRSAKEPVEGVPSVIVRDIARMERLGSATWPVKPRGQGRALREPAEIQSSRPTTSHSCTKRVRNPPNRNRSKPFSAFPSFIIETHLSPRRFRCYPAQLYLLCRSSHSLH